MVYTDIINPELNSKPFVTFVCVTHIVMSNIIMYIYTKTIF